jgi:protein TonB
MASAAVLAFPAPPPAERGPAPAHRPLTAVGGPIAASRRPRNGMPLALPVSAGLHAVALVGALALWQGGEPLDEAALESMSVEIIETQSFSTNSTAPAESDATETLISVGAEPVFAETSPLVEAEPVEVAEAGPEAIRPTETTPAPEPLPPGQPDAAASETIDAEPAEIMTTAGASAVEPVAPAALRPEDQRAAVPEAMAAAVEPIQPTAPLLPDEAREVAEAVEQPVSPATESLSPEEAKPDSVEPEPVEAADAPAETLVAEHTETVAPEAEEAVPVPLPRPERPVVAQKAEDKPQAGPKAEAKTEPKAKPKPVTAAPGNGGAAQADSQAAAAVSAGKGKVDAGGSAAVSRYPGLVQAKLRRALRYPASARGARGEVHVAFVVGAGGGASRIVVVQSSGNAVLDAAAVATVERAAPFPPIPPDAGRSSWSFTMPLVFKR